MGMHLAHIRDPMHRTPATTCALMKMVPDVIMGLEGVKRDWMQGLRLALERWERFSQLSGDRSAMLAVQDYSTVVGCILKLGSGSRGIGSIQGQVSKLRFIF